MKYNVELGIIFYNVKFKSRGQKTQASGVVSGFFGEDYIVINHVIIFCIIRLELFVLNWTV